MSADGRVRAPMSARLTGRPDEGQRPEEAQPQAEFINIQAL
jgi:hypothetical protein